MATVTHRTFRAMLKSYNLFNVSGASRQANFALMLAFEVTNPETQAFAAYEFLRTNWLRDMDVLIGNTTIHASSDKVRDAFFTLHRTIRDHRVLNADVQSAALKYLQSGAL